MSGSGSSQDLAIASSSEQSRAGGLKQERLGGHSSDLPAVRIGASVALSGQPDERTAAAESATILVLCRVAQELADNFGGGNSLNGTGRHYTACPADSLGLELDAQLAP